MTLTTTDLFCGAGGSAQGAAAVDGVHVRLAANHWQLAVDSHAENFPDTDHDCADISQVDVRRYPRTDILWASPECFTAGHLITTSTGQVPIEDVEVGTEVLTHQGRWRRVVRVQNRVADTVIVQGQGHTGIETTSSHKFWLRSSAQKWNNTDRNYRRHYEDAAFAPIATAVENHACWATPYEVESNPHGVESPPLIFGPDRSEAWWLIGRWVGDGSLTFGRNHEVLLTCGFHEAWELGQRLDATGAGWKRSDKRTAAVFYLGDSEARDWLHEHCGHGAAEKQIPTWALSLPYAERRALLDGYLSADGGYTQRRVRVSTVSRKLAISARLLAESLGHRVAMAHDKRTTYSIEGRQGTAQLQWILHWEPTLSSKRSAEAFTDTLHSWSRVRSVRAGREQVTVYNLEVDEDHSYVVDGIVVANCTNHSQAKGIRRPKHSTPDMFGDVLPDAAAERSRATMWDVPRFAEQNHYRAIIVENVVEAARWVMYPAWRQAMNLLGYECQVVCLNSMHAPAAVVPRAPQSRDRVYFVFHRRGDRRPDVTPRPVGWCEPCGTNVQSVQVWKNPDKPIGRYRAQYFYTCPVCLAKVEPYALPAAAAIDWTLPGQRIGDRVKPLSPKTMARIEAGLRKYVLDPYLVERRHEYRLRPVSEPLSTVTANETTKGLIVPLEGRAGVSAHSTGEPMRTQTARHQDALVVPYYGKGSEAKPTTEPIGTLATKDHYALVVPTGGTWRENATSSDDPLPARTTRENDGVAFISTSRGWGQPGADDRYNRDVDQPLSTVAAGGQHHMLVRHNTARGNPGQMCTPASEPARTLTTSGHQSLVSLEVTVDDATFRMLEPHEIQTAMAFGRDYLVLGNRRERVKQLGNAVTPPAAEFLIRAVAEALGGAA